jgi:hypothetical protein
MAPSVRSALWGEYFSAQLTNLASVIYAFEARSATAEQADSVDQIGYVAMEQAVSTRRPIFASRGADQTIGYFEGGRAYDLSDRLRCDYNEATGNLSDLVTGRIVGHVSMDSRVVGVSWLVAELFPPPTADTTKTETSADRPVEAGREPADSSDADIERALKMVRAALGQS